MASHTQLHTEVLSLLRQHCSFLDQRQMTMLASMVAAMTLSETIVFDRWRNDLELGKCLAASWQRRCQRWFSNERIDVSAIYGPLILWATQQWQKPDKTLYLALDTTMLWNSHCKDLGRSWSWLIAHSIALICSAGLMASPGGNF